jgi:hypothetical protein
MTAPVPDSSDCGATTTSFELCHCLMAAIAVVVEDRLPGPARQTVTTRCNDSEVHERRPKDLITSTMPRDLDSVVTRVRRAAISTLTGSYCNQ